MTMKTWAACRKYLKSSKAKVRLSKVRQPWNYTFKVSMHSKHSRRQRLGQHGAVSSECVQQGIKYMSCVHWGHGTERPSKTIFNPDTTHGDIRHACLSVFNPGSCWTERLENILLKRFGIVSAALRSSISTAFNNGSGTVHIWTHKIASLSKKCHGTGMLSLAQKSF